MLLRLNQLTGRGKDRDPTALDALLERLTRSGMVRLAVVLAATLAVFGQIWTYGWLNYDDWINVTDNPFLNPVSAQGLAALWRHAYAGLYIPVAYTLFAAETMVSRAIADGLATGPPDPHIFRVVSLGLHAVNGMLVWSILRQHVAAAAGAAAGAAVFLLHPLQVESVAWISEQRGQLSAALGFAAVAAHLMPAPPDKTRLFRSRDLLAAGLFLLALLSKPQAAAFPGLAFALGWGPAGVRDGWKIRALRLLPWIVAVALVFALSRDLQPTDAAGMTIGWLQRIVVAGDAIAFYSLKLIVPGNLAVDYGRSPDVVLASGSGAVSAVGTWLLVLIVAVVPRLERVRLPLALWLLGLLPTLGFVPFVHQGASTVADRYAYVAMLGPALAVARLWAWRSDSMPGRLAPWLRGALAASIIGCGVLARAQVPNWKDSVAVFRQAVLVNPLSFISHLNLGNALVAQGLAAEAVPVLERAVDAGVAYRTGYKAWAALAQAQHRVGRLPEAAIAYREAIGRGPVWPALHNDYGDVLARQGNFADAAVQFGEAIRLGLDTPDVRRKCEAALRRKLETAAGASSDGQITAPSRSRDVE